MTYDKLDFNDLENVAGGFEERNIGLPTVGMEIVCPKCHKKDPDSFAASALYDPNLQSVEYRCSCGCKFVCSHGKVILREDWDALCKQKGINYPF
jgi:lysyl-tRNA synthetase class I